MHIINQPGESKALLMNRIQCARDTIAYLTTLIESMNDRYAVCCPRSGDFYVDPLLNPYAYLGDHYEAP